MGEFLLGIGDHVLFFLIGIVVPFSAIAQGKPDMSSFDFSPKQKISLYYSNGLMMWFAALLITGLWVYNTRSLSTFGWQAPLWSQWVILMVLLFCILYFADLCIEILNPKRKAKTIEKLKENTPFLPANNGELAHFTFAAFTAGVTEEIIFRGFFVNYILAFSGTHIVGVISAILLPALLFSVVHIYQGHKAVLKILLAGILFGLIYYYSQSLLIVITIHFVMDMISAYVGMKLMQTTTASPGV